MNASEYRATWAGKVIERARQISGSLPRYGSRGWCELPEDDPRKIGAVALAAELWLYDSYHGLDRQPNEALSSPELDAGTPLNGHGYTAAGESRKAGIFDDSDPRRYVRLPCSATDCLQQVEVEWAPGWLTWSAYCRRHRESRVV